MDKLRKAMGAEFGKAEIGAIVLVAGIAVLSMFAPVYQILSDEVRGITYYSDSTGKSSKITPIQAVNYDLLNQIDSARLNLGTIPHGALADTGTKTHSQIDSHINSTSNPHSVTAAQAGASPDTHNHSGVYDPAGTAAGLVANKLDTDSVISSPTATVTYASDSMRIDVVGGGTVTSVTATSPLASTGGTTPVISMAADSVSELANSYANWARIDRCGWVAQPTIQFDADTRTLTMSGTATYHQAGVLKTMTTPTTSQIASAAGTYYFYMDGSTTVDSATSAWSLLDTKIPAAVVIYNGSNTPKYLLEDERHTSLWDRRMHWYEHSTSGTELVSGGTLSGYQTGSSATTNAHNDFGIAEALIADEDLPHTLAALTDPAGSGTTNYLVLYRDGGTGYTWKQTALPYSVTGTYIDYDTGTGTLVEGAANKAYNYYLAYTNIQGQGRHILIPGRSVYASAAAAYAEDVKSFDFTGFPVQEIVIVYQITWETASGYGQTGKCRMSRAPVKISTSVTQVNAASQASNHNALSGLQGGSGTDYYHVSAAQAAQGSLVGGTGFTLTTAADSTRIDYSPTTSSCQTDTTFTSAFLSSGILTFNHNLSSQNVAVEIWDDKYSKVANADSQTNWSENQVRLDLSSFVATSKLTPSTTWRIRALKGGTSIGGTGSATTDASLLTSGTLDSARLPDITTAKTVTNASLTIDAKGRISTASSGTTTGMWTLVERYSANGETSHAFTVNGDADVRYEMVARVITNGSNDVRMWFNSDNTGGHYYMVTSNFNGSTVNGSASSAQNFPLLTTPSAANRISFFTATIDAKTGAWRIIRSLCNTRQNSAGNGLDFDMGIYSSAWTDTSTNITTINISAGGNTFNAGSYIELWKLAQ